jgi:hypothetical protein
VELRRGIVDLIRWKAADRFERNKTNRPIGRRVPVGIGAASG